MGETRVDLLHLLEDLRDAYPGSIEESFVTEAVANALDSGAGTIVLTADPASATLAIVDDGSGMRRRELARYHDLAASTKTRGGGIGFAGVGIKLGLLLAREVRTETRQRAVAVGTTWSLTTRQRAPWRWVPPEGLVGTQGTAVRLLLHDPLSPLLDGGFLDDVIRRQFAPLLRPEFAEILRGTYPGGVRFVVNGVPLEPTPTPEGELVPIALRLARKRKPSAAGWLLASDRPLDDGEQGVAISTLGKVIKRGWDWLGLHPSAGERITGLVEVPALAATLTLNKADFIRTGTRGATYLVYRKALQEALGPPLARWGATPTDRTATRRLVARPVERDVQRILAELAERFPLLLALVDRQRGGQRRLALDDRSPGAAPGGAPIPVPEDQPESVHSAESSEPPPGDPGQDHEPAAEPPVPRGGASGSPKRPIRLGLTIGFEAGVEDADLARLVDTTVMVNANHPAYRRAVSSRSEGYHLALSVALALAPLVAETVTEREFVSRFLGEWGASIGPRRAHRRGPR